MRLWSLPTLGWLSGSAMAANALISPGSSLLLEEEGRGRGSEGLISQGLLGGSNEHLALDRKFSRSNA